MPFLVLPRWHGTSASKLFPQYSYLPNIRNFKESPIGKSAASTFALDLIREKLWSLILLNDTIVVRLSNAW